jgi:alkylated DNA repair dioxygenase AlkB
MIENKEKRRITIDNTIILKEEKDGKAVLYKHWITKKQAKKLLNFCKSLETKLLNYKINGNPLKKQRLNWGCGDPRVFSNFGGVELEIHEWPPELKEIRDLIFQVFGIYTNFCLVNHYRNGLDAIADHSDGELFAKDQCVFTLSLGIMRIMDLINKVSKVKIPFDFEEADLFLMRGNFQRGWTHGINFQKKVTEERFSLTFRGARVAE